MSPRCRIPSCGDPIGRGLFCPSCRLAASGGGIVAFLVFVASHLLSEVEWLAIVKATLRGVFYP